MASGFAVSPQILPLLDVIALGLFYLRDEVVETLTSLSVLNIPDLLSILLRHSHSHLGQFALFLFKLSIEHFLFRIHVIIAVEVDCLRTGRRILQVKLHALNVEILTLIIRQTVSAQLELLAGPNYSRLATASLLTRFANHALSLSTLLMTFIIRNLLINQVADDCGTDGE